MHIETMPAEYQDLAGFKQHNIKIEFYTIFGKGESEMKKRIIVFVVGLALALGIFTVIHFTTLKNVFAPKVILQGLESFL